MSYSLSEIKIAAYNWQELPGMSAAERNLWQGLGYAYECYRSGYDKEICDDMARNYVKIFEKGMMGKND